MDNVTRQMMMGASGRKGFDISKASFDTEFDVSSEDDSPFNAAFNNDGTKLFVVGRANDTVYQYSLSTAYDVSTATYDNKSHSFVTEDGSPSGVAFNTSGTKMFMMGVVNTSLYQYTLSTAFNVSTASYDNISKDVFSEAQLPYGFAFKPDGTRLFVMDNFQNRVQQYSLSTAFDLSTLTYDSVSFNVSSQGSGEEDIAFLFDGTKMLMLDGLSDSIFQYSLSSPYDISTATYDGVSVFPAQLGKPKGILLSDENKKMHIIDTDTDSVIQFNL